MSYIWPVDPSTKGQGFGENPGPPFNPVGGHTGDDFKVPPGTPVCAIGDGTVRGVGQLPEPYTSNPWWIEGQWAGNVVVIDHGPIVSVYAHLSEWHVNLGDGVTQGQVIALSGATGGASTGPHLHFEILPDGWDFNNGTYGRVNPATYCTDTPQENDMGVLESITDEAMNNLAGMVRSTVRAELANIQASVAFQEKYAVSDKSRQAIAAAVWSQPIEGAVNAAGLLVSKAAVSPASVDVDALVVRLKAELPPAVLAALATKLTA